MKLAWLWWLSACSFGSALADQARIEPGADGALRIEADRYQAVIEKDGCMTSLKVMGREFLNNSYTISRGCYFFQGGVQSLAIQRRSSGRIEARNEKVKLEIRADAKSLRFDMSNLTQENMSFFLILDADLEAASSEGGPLQRPPLDQASASSVWHSGPARLELTGSDKLWDWSGSGHTVWEILLEPGMSRTAELGLGPASEPELEAIAQLPARPPLPGEWRTPDLVLLSPKPLQVFQRDTKESGSILISGWTRLTEPLEARVVGDGAERGWLPLDRDQRSGRFHRRLRLSAGGWYSLEVRAGQRQEVVEQFGVGEVFVAAGQSNSTNSGQFRTEQQSGMVSAFNGLEWRAGDDPFWGTHDQSKGGSPWPAFGDALYDRFEVPIGIAVTGHGGTSVNQWQPGRYQTPSDLEQVELFHWMMTRVHQLGPDGFRAVLWHQGESDCARETTESYVEKMTRVIRASNDAAGWSYPWFVAQVSYHNPGAPQHDNIRRAQATLWEQGVALEGPDTDQLTGDHRDYEGQGIHFSPKGLLRHGQMWAEVVIPWLEQQP